MSNELKAGKRYLLEQNDICEYKVLFVTKRCYKLLKITETDQPHQIIWIKKYKIVDSWQNGCYSFIEELPANYTRERKLKRIINEET